MREIVHSGDLPTTSAVNFNYGNPKQMSYNPA